MAEFAREMSRGSAWRGPFSFYAWAANRGERATLVVGGLSVSLPGGVVEDGALEPTSEWAIRVALFCRLWRA
eukprot:5288117-Alexandrium_andersonii.AAC.1